MKELELMIEKLLAIQSYNNFQIYSSKLIHLSLDILLKSILLKRSLSEYESKIKRYNVEDLASEVSRILSYSGEKGKVFRKSITKLNDVAEESLTKIPNEADFNSLIRDNLFLIAILGFQESLISNYDCFVRLIKKIESLSNPTTLDDLFSAEWNTFIKSDAISKKLSINYPLDIYLDQKDWILLARIWKNKEYNSKIKKLLHKLILLAYNDKIRVPLSINHMFETANREDDDSRNELIDLMILLSKGFTIIPYVATIPHEIKNAIYKRLGIHDKIFPVKNVVFSRGIGNITGATPTLQSKTEVKNEFDMKALEAIMYTPEVLRFGFSIKNSKARLDRLNADRAIISKIEQNREMFERQFKDNDLRKRARLATHFSNEIVPILSKIIIDEKIPKEDGAKIIGKTPDEASAFLEEMPTSFCSFILTRRRDEQTSSSAHEHDLYDIASLSVAIPYCDIVVCEKRFGSFAKNEKLDKKYNTLILNNLNELEDYLWL